MLKEMCGNSWYGDKTRNRTINFDAAFPDCRCEAHSFCGSDAPLPVGELMARILTAPNTYSLDAQMIIWHKLIRVYSDGLSLFRPGCFVSEVRRAVDQLLAGGAEPQTLIGAALVTVGTVRMAGEPNRWFCVYDTVSDEFTRHADIAGTRPDITLSRNRQEKETQLRMRNLRDLIGRCVIQATTADELISGLRLSGFNILEE